MINCFAANSRGVRPFAPLYVDIFADDPASTSRGGVLQLGQNDEWQLHRRYMHLEGLQTLSGAAIQLKKRADAACEP
jgi:hypothetical protein